MSSSNHYRPKRQRKALRSALGLLGVGIVIWVIGLIFLFLGTTSGLLVGLIVVGVTIMLLSPVWYFTYMEILEPEIYQHEK